MKRQHFRYAVRFQIGLRLGSISKYSFKELCVTIFDRYSFTEAECEDVAMLKVGEELMVAGVQIKREQ